MEIKHTIFFMAFGKVFMTMKILKLSVLGDNFQRSLII